MRAEEVTDRLALAPIASGCDSAEGPQQLSDNAKGSDGRPSNIGACSAAGGPRNLDQQTRPILRHITLPDAPNVLATDS